MMALEFFAPSPPPSHPWTKSPLRSFDKIYHGVSSIVAALIPAAKAQKKAELWKHTHRYSGFAYSENKHKAPKNTPSTSRLVIRNRISRAQCFNWSLHRVCVFFSSPVGMARRKKRPTVRKSSPTESLLVPVEMITATLIFSWFYCRWPAAAGRRSCAMGCGGYRWWHSK